METLPVKRLKVSERFCPHCNEVLCFKTFQAHKRTFQWIKKETINFVNHDSDDNNERTDTDSCPPSETEMDQYPINVESPPLVDPAIANDIDGMYYMLFVQCMPVWWIISLASHAVVFLLSLSVFPDPMTKEKL